MNELFLFVRPPRPLWPFNGPSSAFWPPLAFASLAATLRERVHDLRVEILDAPALEMAGARWKTNCAAASPRSSASARRRSVASKAFGWRDWRSRVARA